MNFCRPLPHCSRMEPGLERDIAMLTLCTSSAVLNEVALVKFVAIHAEYDRFDALTVSEY
jgi:hypothetical protein